MAIWTKYPQILDSIVVVNAVDVIKLQGKTAVSAHFCPAAQFAFRTLQASLIQSSLQLITLHR